VTHCATAEAAPGASFAWRAALASRGRAIAAPLQKTQRGNAAAGPLQTLAQGAAFLELNARKGSGHQQAEGAMGRAEHGRESLSEMDWFVVLMARARKVSQLIAAVRSYLASWPAARVARVQMIDAGWAPFDEQQQPVAVIGPQDVRHIYDAVHDQIVSLKESGVAPTPEFLEMELVFFLAQRLLQDLEADFPAARAAPHASRREMPDARSKNRTLVAGR
jgi:hypothetical protein